MKTPKFYFFFLICLALPTMVFGKATLRAMELAESAFIDQEVQTNFVCVAWENQYRQVELTVQLTATPTNQIEIAFGMDESGEGTLDTEEVGWFVGWDAGQWVLENPTQNLRFVAAPATTDETKSLRIQITWETINQVRSFTAFEGETPLVFASLSALSEPPNWLYSDSWNLCRMTKRGMGIQKQFVQVTFSNTPHVILLQ